MPILTPHPERYLPHILKEGGAIVVVDGKAVVFTEVPAEIEAVARRFVGSRPA